MLHEALERMVESQPGVLDQIRGARRALGWNVLGNLLDMGQLAFAPATPEVLKLAAALDGTHRMFGKVFRWVPVIHAYCVALLWRLWAIAACPLDPISRALL